MKWQRLLNGQSVEARLFKTEAEKYKLPYFDLAHNYAEVSKAALKLMAADTFKSDVALPKHQPNNL